METIEELIATVRQNIDAIHQYAKVFGLCFFGLLFIHSMFRFLLGKKAQISLSISSAMEIFCMYCILLCLHSFGLDWQKIFPGTLPFISVQKDQLLLFPMLTGGLYSTCNQVLQLLVIAFLVNLINDIIPHGKHIISWYFFRLITVILSIGINFMVHQIFTVLLPPDFMQIAPTVLLLTLVALVLLGSLKLVVGFALLFLDPIIAALYTFFFATFIGRRLARSLVTASLLTLLVLVLNILEINVLTINTATLLVLVPVLIFILLLWYLIGHII